MQLDLLDLGAVLVSVGILLIALIFITSIWAAALGAPLLPAI